jgi:ribonuclease HII
MLVRVFMSRKIDPGLIPSHPDLSFEISLWNQSITKLAGIDEAGRGCLAGPVAAAAVILPADPEIQENLSGVRDSKELSAEQRNQMAGKIRVLSAAWQIGYSSPAEIDRLGILPATCLAVSRALAGLKLQPDHLLVDYLILPEIATPQTRLVKGDRRSLSIAAASILAKTSRDQVMIDLADRYPHYGWKANKGYGTAAHRQALQDHGPCTEHRMSFAPLRGTPD